MEKVSVFAPQGNVVTGTITLNGSKSISNRVLIIRALCEEHFHIENLSEADDTVRLQKLLDADKKTLDAGAGGTTFRFLTAFLATQEGKKATLTGSERMKLRPIKILVEALQQLGADITYKDIDGFPPIHIKGKKLNGGKIAIPANTSSQYISALLMIAPTLKGGLELELVGEMVSKPYILMTLNLMEYFGAKWTFKGNRIKVKEGKYAAKPFYVEADWSAASYFYEIAALSESAAITLKGLSHDSLQGDAVIAGIMEQFGVSTLFKEHEVIIIKQLTEDRTVKKKFIYDFVECPDIAQTLVATCAALNTNATLKGLQTLRIKETDRIAALHNELSKYGCTFTEPQPGKWVLDAKNFDPVPGDEIEISTYDDHRMAMAFAPLCLVTEQMDILDPEVVNKSYPGFWKDVEKLGFVVSK